MNREDAVQGIALAIIRDQAGADVEHTPNSVLMACFPGAVEIANAIHDAIDAATLPPVRLMTGMPSPAGRGRHVDTTRGLDAPTRVSEASDPAPTLVHGAIAQSYVGAMWDGQESQLSSIVPWRAPSPKAPPR